MGYLQNVSTELAITIANRDVWLSIGLAILLGIACWSFGSWVARTVGILQPGAPAGEMLGVGLACGLLVVAAWWAAVWSGGRSSFTPVAIGFAVAIGLALARRARQHEISRGGPHPAADRATSESTGAAASSTGRRSFLPTALAAGLFVVVIAILYGSTLAPSPRDGGQPVEKVDVAFYAVLGRDLATTGTETNTLPSGFSRLPVDTTQTWYHWGELWLAAAVITIFGQEPLAARYLVVLPLVLLAAAALTGTVVSRLSGRTSRLAFVYGFIACLVLAPMPLVFGPFFSAWPVGLIAGIAVFGLAPVAVLFAWYALLVLDSRPQTWSLACFVGTAIAFVLPEHIVIAILGLVGLGTAWTIGIGRSLMTTGSLPPVPVIWRRTLIAAAVGVALTAVFGRLTDHGLGNGASMASVTPFNLSWRETIGVVSVQAGMLLTPPVAWLILRRDVPRFAAICLGTTVLVIAGAIVWGWRLATFNMFYFFFGALAIFVTPVAVAAVWLLVERIRSAGHPGLAVAVITLCAIQLELGIVLGLGRLQGGSATYEPIPVSILQAIVRLPEDAKVAYACQPLEEISFVNSKLLGIDAHTGRRIVPMCFQADALAPLFGVERSAQTPDAAFVFAPQATLYPDSTARPPSTAVSSFLKAYGIDYIYADAAHPNSLVTDAVPIATSADFELLRVP